MSSNTMETEDLAKFAVGGRALRSRRIRRALIARLINERANGSDDDADEGTTGDSGDEDHQLVRALVGSRVLQRRRFRRLLLAKLIRARASVTRSRSFTSPSILIIPRRRLLLKATGSRSSRRGT